MPRKNRQERLAKVALLDHFQFTTAEIARVLEVSEATVIGDMRLLKADGGYTEDDLIRVKPSGRFRVFFKSYAEIILTGRLEMGLQITASELQLLKRALEDVLRVSEILAHLKGVEATLTMPLVLEFETLPYYDLFCAAMKNDPRMVRRRLLTAGEFWNETLAAIYRGAFVVLNSFPEQVADFVRGYIMTDDDLARPQWSSEVQRMFREKIERFFEVVCTPKQVTILKSHYGFEGSDRLSFAKIAAALGLSPTSDRPRQIHGKALRGLHRYCMVGEKEWFMILLMRSAEGFERSLRHVVERREDERRSAVVAGESAHGEVALSAAQQRSLAQSPREAGASVRLSNALKDLGLSSLTEVLKKSEREFLKSRNFGRKALNELKKILEERGLRLGMDPSVSTASP